MERTGNSVVIALCVVVIIILATSNASLNKRLGASNDVINRVFYDNPDNYATDSLQFTPEYIRYCITFDLAGDVYDD